MINRKAPTRSYSNGAYIAFLLKRWSYVHGSLLSVAHYPKPLAKLRIIEDICKKMGKKLRKFYVKDEPGKKKRATAVALNPFP